MHWIREMSRSGGDAKNGLNTSETAADEVPVPYQQPAARAPYPVQIHQRKRGLGAPYMVRIALENPEVSACRHPAQVRQGHDLPGRVAAGAGRHYRISEYGGAERLVFFARLPTAHCASSSSIDGPADYA